MLIAIKSMGGESTEAWRAVLDDLIQRGLRRPEFLIIDGASGLENAIAAVWDGVPVQRCTVHKHRNLLAHAPERLREEITADYNDMIYAATREETKRAAKHSSENGGSSTVPSPTAWTKPATGSSPSPVCRQVSGAAFGPPTPSSGCTRSSSDGSRRRPFCHRPTLPPCCSGRCSPPARSTCARSTAGKRSLPSPLINQLTSPLDQIASSYRRMRRANSNHMPGGTRILATETVAFELRLSRRLSCLVCRRRTAHQEAHIPFNDLNAERHEGCRFRMSADRSRAGRSGKHLLVLSLTGLTALMVVYL